MKAASLTKHLRDRTRRSATGIGGAANISFTGEVHDDETGLDAYKFRSYNPQLGRWMSPDPSSLRFANLAVPQTFNLYAYVTNDPLKYIDIDGLLEVDNSDLFISDGSDSADTGDALIFAGGGGGGGIADSGSTSTPPCLTDTCISVTATPDPPPPLDPGPIDTTPIAPVPADPTGLPSKPIGIPVAPSNPCVFAGTSMPPSSYAGLGQQVQAISSVSLTAGLALNAANLASFHKGGSLDAQTGSTGTVWESAAYGNYVYGVYNAAAGFLTLSQTLDGANAYAAASQAVYPASAGRDPNYPSLPPANVQNITNGYLAQQSGTTCTP